MNNRWVPLLIICSTVVLGHILSRIHISKYKHRYIETGEFRDKFIDLVNYYTEHCRVNQEMYIDCIRNVNVIQAELGDDGVIAEFLDPLKNVRGKNYQLLVNTLPEMKLFSLQLDNIIIRQRLQQLFDLCDDAMIKHLGALERMIENESKKLWNPFACLSNGVRWLIGLPLDILCWMGIISEHKNSTLQSKSVFKWVGHIVSLVGLISSIMGIILGWDEFISLFTKL